jgi:hypothetical protein
MKGRSSPSYSIMRITFKVAPHYMYVSESFIDEVSDDWKKLTKVIKIERINNE